jgi:hypothetical protein
LGKSRGQSASAKTADNLAPSLGVFVMASAGKPSFESCKERIYGVKKPRRVGALLAALAMAGGGTLLSASQAHAAQTPQP